MGVVETLEWAWLADQAWRSKTAFGRASPPGQAPSQSGDGGFSPGSPPCGLQGPIQWHGPEIVAHTDRALTLCWAAFQVSPVC